MTLRAGMKVTFRGAHHTFRMILRDPYLAKVATMFRAGGGFVVVRGYSKETCICNGFGFPWTERNMLVSVVEIGVRPELRQ